MRSMGSGLWSMAGVTLLLLGVIRLESNKNKKMGKRQKRGEKDGYNGY